MRVVAGTARGRRLAAPTGLDVRPTTDRVREATFNALHSLGAVADATAVDLFAGTGALGIEALSRGARHVTFVEPDRAARAVVAENLATVGFADRATVVSTTAESFLLRQDVAYDLVFCDPPYEYAAWPDLFAAIGRVVAPDGLVVVESDRSVEPPPGWEVARDKRYGGTVVGVVMPPPVLRDRSGDHS
jgi:16S rRNA (guanine966-N2)-methyltransferase